MSGGLNGGVTDQSLLFFLYKWATFYSVGSNSFVEIVQSSRRPSVEKKKILKRRYLKSNKVSVVMYLCFIASGGSTFSKYKKVESTFSK